MNMDASYFNLIESAIVLLLYFGFKKIISKIISKTKEERLIHERRAIVMKKIVNLLLLAAGLIAIFLIWGVDQSEIALVLGSILTIVGVAFFAQWSLLSNVTSSIILFFNHPVKLNDYIILLEGKDYVLEGRVVDIGLFFVTILTSDNGKITLPNNVFIQKSIMQVDEAYKIPQDAED